MMSRAGVVLFAFAIVIWVVFGALMLLPPPARQLVPASPHEQCAGERAKVGMTREQLLDVCGKPRKINTDELKDGYKHEQFVYTQAPHQRDYVYVDRGVVTSIQY